MEDFPPEAFLARPKLVEHAASLLRTVDGALTQTALRVLRRLVERLRCALRLAGDGSMLPQGAAAPRPAGAAYPQPPPPSQPVLPPGAGEPRELGVTPLLHPLVLACLPLAANPGCHADLLPLLVEAAPLLAPERDAAGGLTAASGLRLQQYLRALSDASGVLRGAAGGASLASVALLDVVVRLMDGVPPGEVSALAPLPLLEAMAAAALDGAVGVAQPGLQAALLPLLSEARPDVAAVRADADAAGGAAVAAAEAADMAQRMADGEPLPAHCVITMREVRIAGDLGVTCVAVDGWGWGGRE